MRFSERYGYEKPSDVIVREKITLEIQNSICTCFDLLAEAMSNAYFYLQEYLWCNFLNQRKAYYRRGDVSASYIENSDHLWYEKLDLIEEVLKYLRSNYPQSYFIQFSVALNTEFERLNFGYRIVDGSVTEITSGQEIKTIETALENNKDNVRMHLNNALKLYAQRPVGDYRNSIKESISAVEALNRTITGENTLNLKKMEDKGLKIPSVLRAAFEKLYGYTNDGKTGIRHSLMGETGKYVPGAEEALYMLITCSAFINYLNTKLK